MRKIETESKQVMTTKGEKITLMYSVTIDDLTANGLTSELEYYGLCIDIVERCESESVRGITVSAAEINAMVKLIADNLVTPCTLIDVVCDLKSVE